MKDNEERELWVLNDEGLYTLAQDHPGGIDAFVLERSDLIDEVIENVTTGRRRQHYLVYG